MNRTRFAGLVTVPLLFACQAIIDGTPSTGIPHEAAGNGAVGASPGTGGAGGTGSATGGTGQAGKASTGGTGGDSGSSTGGTAGSNVGTGSGELCDVQALLREKCQSCHSSPPALRSVPMALVSYDDLVAPAPSDAAITTLEMSIARMQDTMSPMPPAPAAPATAADVQVLQAWLDAGKPSVCDPGTAGTAGAGGSGEVAANPYDTPVTCTTGKHWTGGNEESPNMHPGGACINCHTSGGEEEGPRFDFAGTVYPSAHEPTDCNGLDGATGMAQVIITDANGATFALTVNSVGNFSYSARGKTVALPYRAKVVQNGRERIMSAQQQSGDCNLCHTESGDKDAPGRIMAP